MRKMERLLFLVAEILLVSYPMLTYQVSLINLQKTTMDDNLSRCIKSILRRDLNDELIIIYAETQMNHMVYNIVENFLGSALIYNDEAEEQKPSNSSTHYHITKCMNYIVLIQSATSFEHFLHKITKKSFWNPQVRFLVILDTCNSSQEESLLAIFKSSLGNKILDIVVLLKKIEWNDDTNSNKALFSSKDESIVCYSYFPFTPSSCFASDTLVLMDEWKDGGFVFGHELYPKKANKLQGCEFIICAWDIWPTIIIDYTKTPLQMNGINGKFIDVMSEHMNLTYVVKGPSTWPTWGTLLANGTYTGIPGEVLYNRADIGMFSFPAAEQYYNLFEPVLATTRVDIVWVVPLAKMVPLWKNLFLIYESVPWILIGFTYIFASAFVHCFNTHVPKELSTMFSAPPLKLLSLFLGISITKEPESISSRMFFSLWAFYSLVISTCYTSFLVTFLTHPLYELQIDSAQDVVDSGIALGGMMREIFKDEGSSVDKEILKRWEYTYDAEEALERIADTKDFALVIDLLFCEYVINKYFLDENGNPRVHLATEIIASIPGVFLLPKGSPFFVRINSLIISLQESGIVEKWTEDIAHSEKLKGASSVEYQDDNKVVISQKHLAGAISTLLVLLAFSTVTFVCELLYSRVIAVYRN